MSALDTQVGGKAYSKTYPEWPIQPVEFIHKNGIDFIRGCIIKYVCRDRFKNGHEDLRKARHYIDLLLELDDVKAKEDLNKAPKPGDVIPYAGPIPTAREIEQAVATEKFWSRGDS